MPGWIFGAYAAVAATIALVKWLTDANRALRNEIKKHPITPIHNAQENETVRLSGTLRYIGNDGAPLTAPVSSRPCAAWHVIVWRLEGGKNKSWRKVLEERDSRDFLLKEGEAVAQVDGTWIDLLLHKDSKEQTRLLSEPTEGFRSFLTEHGLPLHGTLGFRQSYRVHEGILEEGERVTVVGVGKWEADPSRMGKGYRDVGKRFRIGSMDDGRLLASDEAKLAYED